ncbi:MAG: aminodeoxychorismate lyase [Rickettsiales bacterium]|nr:MAG: aminodeoxychorismate lyase [Rickettsiales bacterium]
MLKKVFKIKLLLIIVAAVFLLSIVNILGSFLFLPGNLQKEKTIIIKPNLSISQISALLEDAEIIKNKRLFEITCQIYSYHKKLKVGEYRFTQNITPYQIINKLTAGKSIVHRLFIPEGTLVHEIIEQINANELLFGKKISHTIPEGYLMPSTYFYSYGDQREHIVNKMRTEMSEALDAVMLKLSKNSPIKTRKDVLILASIVEKEAGNDRERPKVAAVFINRLNKKMKLQADPTTIYAITNGKYKLERSLTRKDLRIKSPYNTYHTYGLPVAPISCPGRASLEAVVAPAKTTALYFVVNGRGGHSFSNSLKEHNKHVRKFKARVKRQKARRKRG